MRSLHNFCYRTSVHCICPLKPLLTHLAVKKRIYFPVIKSKASSPFMVSKASSKATRGERKGELATISYKFPFLLCPDEAKYYWLKNDVPSINFDWGHSWLTCHKYLPYDAYWSLEYYDYSFLSVIGQRFLKTVWLYFLPFSLDLNPPEYIRWQIRRLKRVCQENIGILNLSVFVVFKSFPTTKVVDFISKWMPGR